MIPLRDANPTRRTPIVTLALIIACFVVFAYELGRLGSVGTAALDAFVPPSDFHVEDSSLWILIEDAGMRGESSDSAYSISTVTGRPSGVTGFTEMAMGIPAMFAGCFRAANPTGGGGTRAAPQGIPASLS